MRFKNAEMELMIAGLKKFLPMKNKIGYVAARNTRLLMTETTEYYKIRDELIMKYGEPDRDEEGNELQTVSIGIGSEAYRKFDEAIKEYANIEHDVPVMKMRYDEVVGILSGEEILMIDWMLEDGKAEASD